ncbi:MAG: nitrate ABC transporter, permease protein [Cytophagaceae bacterium]|nr:MAG: nitrate ABC transporter, permease protein [Cytophagaceae bacterium]
MLSSIRWLRRVIWPLQNVKRRPTMKKLFTWSLLLTVGSFALSMLILLGIWSLVTLITKNEIPGPVATWTVFYDLLQDPFYDYGPNDKGIGIQLWASIKRVFSGFLIGSLIAIPAGLLMGASKTGMRLLNPIVQILRPVSPLAWFPLGLLAFKASDGATVFIIAITSLWPTLVNTAFGVASIPQDFKNVGRAYGFPIGKYITKILIPYALPHIITGLRLSIGIAWMVIVAGEMLSGGVGIGFFVWDSWNGLSLEKILSAILIIGIVGLLLDKLFSGFQKWVAYE